MRNLSLRNIAAVCGGTYHGAEEMLDREVDGVVIDSRLVKQDYLFVAMKGARVDGHTFIPDVMKAGALCALTENMLADASFPYIRVYSCPQALKDLAAFYRRGLRVKVVGITGSVGKTSTKEAIAAVLGEHFKVHKTAGNFNNEIGLPLTIFQISEADEAAVLEMGISDFGEMSRLAAVAQPDIAVITNIGTCHLEFLHDRAGILEAKTEMFDYLSDDGIAVLNGDDDMLRTIKEVNGRKPLFFGTGEDCDVSASRIEDKGFSGTSCTVRIGGETIDVMIPVPGRHMVYNVLAAAAVGMTLGVSPDEIKNGISRLAAVEGRGRLIETGKFTVMDDCYNANPVSMKASLDVLSGAAGRRVAVLGDMFELGAAEHDLHREVGAYAAKHGVDLLLCVGPLAQETADGAAEAGLKAVHKYPDKKALLSELSSLLMPGDTVLVKASHGMQFEEIVSFLKDKK